MGFGEAIKTCFEKYVVFRGRARRSEYWYFILFGFLVSLLVGVVEGTMRGSGGSNPGGSLVSLALFLPQLSVTVRRLHDTNHSGWWIGGFYLFIAGAAMLAIMTVFGPAGRGTTDPSANITLVVLVISALFYVIWLFILTILKGTDGPNRFGPDPTGPNVDVFS